MVNKFKVIALAGALGFVAAPAFAQDAGLPIIGDLPIVGSGNMGGMDLDPFHIFTPAAAPMAAPAPMMHKHMMMHHKHMMMGHKHMMMHHKKMMMHHKMMMKKAM